MWNIYSHLRYYATRGKTEPAIAGSKVSNPGDMGRTVSNASGYAPEDDQFDPRTDDFVSKERKYTHFDLPLTEAERTGITFSDSDIIAHSFWPLLGFVEVERRAKRDASGQLVFEDKERAIKFGSHKDAALLEFYAKDLSIKYEKFLQSKNYSQSILAYRKGVGNNIDQAKSIFDEIRARKNCIAIALDIKGFFDNIDHKVLKSCLLDMHGEHQLDNPAYKVFERMTKFEWVDSDLLKNRLGPKYGRSGRICTSKEFRDNVRGIQPSLINKNKAGIGIPQGTPLSGLYANISLTSFDHEIHSYLESLDGSYRRYSDDIAVIIPATMSSDDVLTHIVAKLREIGLEISPKKTEIRKFSTDQNGLSSDRPFQYLGFTFDGKKILIRQSSLARYYSKMHSGIKSKIRAAKNGEIDADKIFLRELFKRYTHFGKRRNFPRYAYSASEKLESPEIRRQLRRHFYIFKKALRYYINRAYT